MSERAAVEKVVKRMYEHFVKNTGRLPGSTETRAMERRAKDAAERGDNKRRVAKRRAR